MAGKKAQYTTVEEEALLTSDEEKGFFADDDFGFQISSPEGPPSPDGDVIDVDTSGSIILLDDDDEPVSHQAPGNASTPAPQEEGESMSEDIEASVEEPPSDEWWAYRPLEPFMEAIQDLVSEQPDLLPAIQTCHNRMVEIIRKRPCQVEGIALTSPCIGKIKKPLSRPIRSARYVSVQEVRQLVDESTQTGVRWAEKVTQTDGINTRTRSTQTEGRGIDQATQVELSTEDQAPNVSSTTRKPPSEERTEVTDRPTGDPLARYVGWHTIEGKATFIAAPRPGCWACGKGYHRATLCPNRDPNFKYCYRCGLGNVTIKECPVHGQPWREEGPYVPAVGRNIPRTQFLARAERKPYQRY